MANKFPFKLVLLLLLLISCKPNKKEESINQPENLENNLLKSALKTYDDTI